VATLIHLRFGQGTNWKYVALSLSLYAALLLLQISAVVSQNLIQHRHGARAYLSLQGKDGVVLKLNMEKALKARPGQFIYVWMACSPLQTHPFMIVSAEENTLTVLIQSQNGFSRKLRSIAEVSDSDTPYLAWIDGPYGDPPDFGQFQSIILITNGIGIASYLSILSKLVSGYHERSARVLSIKLYWHFESSGSSNFVI
jgi:predicted ferric reductase